VLSVTYGIVILNEVKDLDIFACDDQDRDSSPVMDDSVLCGSE
jgi:hypothetical protein